MDVLCVKCGEPWDTDSLHEAKDEQGITYIEAWRQFVKDGCAVFGERCDIAPAGADDQDLLPNEKAAMVYELLGDDVDGAAAMLDNFGVTS